MKEEKQMPKYRYWLIEKITVYKEIEAEDRDQANEIIEEFMHSDHIDWGMGDMEYNYEFDGEKQNA
jgi:exoribonuclease II